MERIALDTLKPCPHRKSLGDKRITCLHPRMQSFMPDGEIPPVNCVVCTLDRDENQSSFQASSPPPKPSLVQKAASYAKALARHKANGSLHVPSEVKAHRRSICDSCQYRDAAADECMVCGCKLHNTILGDKLAWASEGCPQGKWGEWKGDSFQPGAEPPAIALALSVTGMDLFTVNLPRLSTGAVQVWADQGSAPIWGKAEGTGGKEESWFSPFDWYANVSRFDMDGPNRRFVLSFDRYTSELSFRLIATKLSLLSITPFLAIGSGLLMSNGLGSAVTACKRLALSEWSVTITEAR